MSEKPLSVLDYHARTKHHFQRYAAGPGGLDWATQPDPFRVYAGSPRLALPLLDADHAPHSYTALYQAETIAPQMRTLEHVAGLLELSLGLSAWKVYGDSRWALRCNPSSGNLHPTEAYVIVQGIAGMADGVHHYVSRDHALEQRCVLDTDQAIVPQDGFWLGLSSIHWREAWKYGERAYRYCQHDAGHAIAAVRYAAAVMGWHAQIMTHWSDADIARLLGLDRTADFEPTEAEHPDLIMWISRRCANGPLAPPVLSGTWQGKANRLSSHHAHDWPIIDAVAETCRKPATPYSPWSAPDLPAPVDIDCTQSAVSLIRQRRSAQALDGVSAIGSSGFFRMLDMCMPRPSRPPFDAIDWSPRVHLVLFVHRVEDLEAGVYILPRHPRIQERMQAELSVDFDWQRIDSAPAHLPLYRVVTADARAAAKALSCHQEIAADGAFSLGMLAEFDHTLGAAPWVYRQLFWETGLIGQVLYLEAEAAGLRGTGIGCFFDDGVHDVLGIQGHWLQSLYHFTIGGPINDPRLQSLPPYAHLGSSPPRR